MHQQINLYQPIFREERKLFSLSTVVLALTVVSVALVSIWLYGLHNVNNLDRSVQQLKQQQAAQEKMAQAAGALFDAQGNPAQLQAVVQVLSAQLAERTRALELLRSGALGEPRGFAPRLQALARQHLEGVWLEELLLGGGPNGLVLRGRCVDPELLPKYLHLLTTEPELSGARFDEVIIDRFKEGDKVQGARKQQNPFAHFSIANGVSRRLLEDHGS
jgi:hypothetical protein